MSPQRARARGITAAFVTMLVLDLVLYLSHRGRGHWFDALLWTGITGLVALIATANSRRNQKS